ncbi:helix-turn-helix domain-containing protein [Streptomyces longwoodensis]|uniref:helix-turn-helix domain-containing protein n=1 Tax=Streptomyces longwoodensis TaxID=68231 RepID=UPI0036B83E77
MKWRPEDWARLGAEIRWSRDRQGYSRKRLAEMSGVSEKSIQLTEEGRVPTRWPKSLDAIEKALDWLPGTMIQVLNGVDVRSIKRDGTPIDASGRGIDVEVTHPGGEKQLIEAKDYRQRSTRYQGADSEIVISGHLAQDVFMRQAKRYRKLQDVSQQELAERVAAVGRSLTADDVQRLENGTRLLHVAEAGAIASALGTTVEWLLGSGFSEDAPEAMRWPPNDEELQAEAKAMERRMGQVRGRSMVARQQFEMAEARAAMARTEADMARAMLESAEAQMREMERHYQYVLGRIDSLRAAKGESTVIQYLPVYEDEEEPR